MQEPKFRAWVKSDRKFRRVNGLRFIDEYGRPCFLIEIQRDYGNEFLTAYEVDLVQFSGRRDQTGKDVYEGDIYQVPNGDICLIEFVDHDLVATVIDRDCSVNGIHRYESWGGTGGEGYVLGNKFQNPDMLKVYAKDKDGT